MDAITAALAGLLHDVGKLWQRAEAGPDRVVPTGYERFSKENFGANGTHAAWSAAFVERFMPASLRQELSSVLYHHNPQISSDTALIVLADRLAAGERADSAAEQPMQSSSILADLAGNTGRAYWPLRPLDLLRETLFPIDQPLGDKEVKRAYQTLWAGFSEDAEWLQDFTDRETLLAELLGLLERYAWSVPTAYYRSRPDISLYDHSRVTAALAACLAEQSEDAVRAGLQKSQTPPAAPVAVLLRGDISGVQKFIYTITARGATQSLRGRSFFLQLLTEAIARWILRRLRLPVTNLIYAGGGHFDLLVAASHEANIPELQADLDAILLDQFDGDLYVALGAATLTQKSLQREEFHERWRAAGRTLSAQKRQRFQQSQSRLFDVRGLGGGSEVECQVCHYEGPDVQLTNSGTVFKCSLCRSLEGLGKDLRGAEALLLAEVAEPKSDGIERSWSAVLRRFGLAVSIRKEEGEWSAPIPDAIRGELIGLQAFPGPQDVEDAHRQLDTVAPLARRQRFTVNVAPRIPNRDHATFEHLQNASTGLSRLGVLRMDVDDLGSLFAEGFRVRDDKDKDINAATLARVASLSSALSRFFEGWVGVLAKEMNRAASDQSHTEPIYTIYSGGDDLFIVGAWDAIVRLAVNIRDDFARYASGNPHIHLSAGISLHGGKEPLYQAAQTAGEALESAKAVEKKDAISFLGESLKWDDFSRLISERKRLQGFLEQGVDRSVLRVLMDLDVQRADTAKRLRRVRTKSGDPQVAWGPYMWRGAYLLRRFADRTKGPAREAFHQYVDELRGDNFQHIRNAALAARWVDALTRKENKS